MHDNRQNDSDFDRDNDDPAELPCSNSDSDRQTHSHSPFRQSPRPSTSPTPYLFTPAGRGSPLRHALSSPPPCPTSSSTPLLKASLSCPPVAHGSLLSVDVTSSSTTPAVPASMDLSMGTRKRRLIEITTTSVRSPPKSPGLEAKRTSPNPEMYSNLLLQLRQQPNGLSGGLYSSRLSAAARKEKLKCRTCFQCPVCKKRFQRHIAMSAHFQTEHIGQSGPADKVCLICSHKEKDVQAIRSHLAKDHLIDLDNPTSCLVEPETGVSITSVAAVSPNHSEAKSQQTVSSSQGRRQEEYSSEAVSPRAIQERLEALSAELKRDSAQARLDHAQDMRIGGRSGSYHDKSGSVIVRKIQSQGAGKRAVEEPSGQEVCSITISPTDQAKGGEGPRETSKSIQPPWSCQHCTIIFPNQTLYFLHRGFHSEGNPWRCNGCRTQCTDMYDFNAHLVSDQHH